MAKDQILDKQHYTAIKAAQRKLHDLIDELAKADACGIQCDDLRQVHSEFSDMLTKMEQQYFPVRPQ